jgi:hypothetical protein
MHSMTVRLTLVTLVCSARIASAQVTPAATATPPDDTPSVKVGAVIYADYTYQQSPKIQDSDNNSVNLSSFNVTRSYINITGNISHIVAFRITPDVARETSSFSNLAGSLEFRIKYAYAQFNLDDWMTKGSWARFGIQQTPWLDYAENIYRYRFQGTMFVEREGFFASADGGASFHYNLPSNYGDVHVGVYNGENYNKAEVNNEKSVQVRGSLRPFANPGTPEILRGLRGHVFYDADNYVKDGPRNRFITGLTYEQTYINAGFEFLDTADRTSITKPEVDGRGYSIWATPKSPKGYEALLRYDHLKPNTSLGNQVRNRTIVGVAYWFPHQGSVASALLLDYDSQKFDNFAPALPKATKVAVHGLISF